MPTLIVPSLYHWIREASARSSPAWDVWRDIILTNWHLGITAFGGPPVHFQMFHKKFVQELEWIDEQTYQELFGISQALPGPASTKMLFCINCIRGGFTSGFIAFILWCLPGALGMYGLSLGISKVGDTLPAPVYALISGLNAATVGIIALAAVQLAEKAITDKFTRLLVFLGGAVGMLYSSLWYFPVLMVAAGLAAILWDFRWLHNLIARIKRLRKAQQLTSNGESQVCEGIEMRDISPSIAVETSSEGSKKPAQLRRVPGRHAEILPTAERVLSRHSITGFGPALQPVSSPMEMGMFTWKIGVCIIAAFLASFTAVLTIRSVVKLPPRGLSLFANLYLAGTIIFGGGPVVIPLLREYVVAEGWVSPRDFLLGLAIIQSFPGPNFNFAVYLGSLAAARSPLPAFAGAVIAFLGIFAPGLIIVSGIMGFWRALRTQRWLISLLRGVNAAGVGLVYTAVYRLWQIGLVNGRQGSGSPLGSDPWWVAITVTSFVGGRWFGLTAPLAILLGGVLGIVWYAVVKL